MSVSLYILGRQIFNKKTNCSSQWGKLRLDCIENYIGVNIKITVCDVVSYAHYL